MGCNNNCGVIGTILGIVVGAVVGILFAFGFIPFITTVVWIVFGLGVLSLIALIIGLFAGAITAPNALSKCLHKGTPCLLAGIIGTIISTIIALAIVLNPALIAVITIVAIGAFFFTLMMVGLVSLILCIAFRINQ